MDRMSAKTEDNVKKILVILSGNGKPRTAIASSTRLGQIGRFNPGQLADEFSRLLGIEIMAKHLPRFHDLPNTTIGELFRILNELLKREKTSSPHKPKI